MKIAIVVSGAVATCVALVLLAVIAVNSAAVRKEARQQTYEQGRQTELLESMNRK